MNILAFESSCDETAVAIVRNGREVLCNEIISQIDIHTLYGGVVPEIASRAHVEAISKLTTRALSSVGGLDSIDAIAVTNAPGLIGALLVGVNFAKSLAFSAKKKLIPVHHIRGHVAAAYITHPTLEPPFTALIVSGGHSHIVNVDDYTKYKILARTRDDAVGESFDKIARVLGLGYPGGPKIEFAAKTGNPNAIRFPRVHFENSLDFSFSGVKTSVINYVHNKQQANEEINTADVAASFTQAVCEILTQNAILATKDKLILAGGVSANKDLRTRLSKACKQKNIKFFFPDFCYCGDNAAMIGAQAFYEYQAGISADESLNAFATKSLE